jgi:DNA-binding transcriptional MerR regulator
MNNAKYRIGDIARLANVTIRSVRYYESINLLSPTFRSSGGQRYYDDRSVVVLKRIIELKNLDFSLDEIKVIIKMSEEDKDGSKRRNMLLHQYRNKLSQAIDKKLSLESRIDSISWHIRQLESSTDFRECPGLDCKHCNFSDKCIFYQDNEIE